MQQNGFARKDIKRALRPHPKRVPAQKEKLKPIAKACLPYTKASTKKVSKVLKKHNIETTFITARKIGQILTNAKTKIQLEIQGVYEISCKDCERRYVGQTNRRINA